MSTKTIMTADYKAGRQTIHLNMSDDELDRRLGAVANAFDSEWLSAANGHPLKALWRRQDGFAVNQLCILGHALAGLYPIDPRWVKEHVDKIKGNEVNERRGSMFELLGAALFLKPPQTIKPTKRSNPGYDAVLMLPDQATVDISLKSYGTSTHELEFRKQAAHVQEEFTNLLKSRDSTGGVLNVFANTFPSAQDWEQLCLALPNLQPNTPTTIGVWSAKIGSLPVEYSPYSLDHLSYIVFIAAPFHKNESKNLSDKFDEAFANAERHAKQKPDGVRAVLLRIPETISLKTCDAWAKDYLASNQNSPIDAIFLYQIAVVERPDDQSVIGHAISESTTPRFQAWRTSGSSCRSLGIELAVGVPISPSLRLIVGGPAPINLHEAYAFQKGDLYTLHVFDPYKPTTATIRNVASGIFQHAVLKNSDGSMTLGGKFAPSKEISLFD
jgi:hypothetical protein